MIYFHSIIIKIEQNLKEKVEEIDIYFVVLLDKQVFQQGTVISDEFF